MTTTIQELFTLGQEFNNKNIRLCEKNGVKFASVLDVIKAVTDGQAKVYWSRMKQQHEEIIPLYTTFKFPGQGSQETPVADCETMLRIIYFLPGKKAHAFVSAGIWSFLNVLNPDGNFIEELKERYDKQSDGQPSTFFMGNSDEKIVRLAPRVYNETKLYIRACLPPEYMKKGLLNPKQLSTNVLKFGIAYSLQDRNATYLQDPDNGFMCFSFPCTSKKEAEIIENILKFDFKDITVLNSREYVDTVRLAEMLNVVPYSTSSYTDYIKLAEQLFVYMVRRVKAIWPDRYTNQHGTVYNLTENMPMFSQSDPASSSSPLEVELALPCNHISDELALKMGITIPESTAEFLLKKEKNDNVRLQRQLFTLQTRLEERTDADAPTVEQINPRSHGAIIARDLVTGEELTFNNCEQAGNAYEISPASLRRTFLDKPRQLKGKHWRKPDKPYWIPPLGFVYDPESFEITNRYIKAVSPDGLDVRVYESVTAAATFLSLNRRSLTDFIGVGKVYNGFIWTELPFTEWGSWSTDNRDEPTADQPLFPVSLPESGLNGRCKGKIIARDLTSGEEVTYASVTRAAAFHKMSAHALTDNFVDKPRQAFGKHFRSFPATHFWQPPAHFKYNKEGFETKSAGYVESIDTEGNRALYENVKAAAEMTGVKRWGIQQYIDTETIFGGRLWKRAKAEDYEFFEPVQSPAGDCT